MRRLLIAVPALLAAAALAACSSASTGGTSTGGASTGGASTSSTPTSTTPTSAGAGASSPAVAGTKQTAALTEFHIALTSTDLAPGTYSFAVKNAGKITHALSIDGPGVSDATTGDMSPGATKTLTVTLKAGSYDFFCPVGDHKSEGMDETVKVG